MVKTALPYENIGFLAASLPPKRPFKGPKLFEGPPWSSRPSFWIFSGSLATIIENSSSYPYHLDLQRPSTWGRERERERERDQERDQ